MIQRQGSQSSHRAASPRSAPPREGEPTPDKPDEVSKLQGRTWKFALRRTIREFSDDECLDLGAALTYYAVLALAPGLVAVVSLLGLVGQGQQGSAALTDVVGGVAPAAADPVRDLITTVAQSGASGFGLIFGLLGALWSASGYIGAFGRAMNRIYEIDEGRPFYKLKPTMLLITLFAVVMAGLVAIALVISGPVARSIGSVVGLGDTAVTIWNIAKWPVMLVVVILVVAVLYYATPNVRQPRFRWVSIGAAVAVVIWIIASVGFGFYVANFAHYDKTYGTLGGAIALLLWLWITNLALLFGAELDSELERGRQLQSGIDAGEELQLPPKDTKASDKLAAKDQNDLQEAERIRREAPTENL